MSSGIGAAIYSRLCDDSTVNELAGDEYGTRVYPEFTPDRSDAQYPLIVYDIDDNDLNSARHYSGSSLASYRVRLACIATTYPETVELSQAVIDALDDQSGTWGGIVVQGAFLEGQSEDVTQIVDAQEKTYHLNELEFTVWATR